MRKLLTVVFAMLSCSAPHARVEAQACTPVMLCPYVGGDAGGRAGTGGVGGGGSGGRSGTGGTGGRAGGGGAGGTGGGLVVQAALELDKRLVKPAGVLNASVTYRNSGSAQITVREIRIAARGPGATHAGGPYTDLAPVATNVVLQPGGYVTLQASRTFTAADPLGEWEAYSTHQDAAGVWHDAPSESFALIGQPGPTPPKPGSGMQVGTQEWFVAPWAGTQLYRANVNWATAYSSGADIWNPEFIADLQGFVVFRHMDTNATNYSKISKWSQRKLPTDPGNQEIYIDGASPSSTTGMAIEWQIDLCNRANVDCWFTLPYLADNDYVSQQAALIKAKLSPALKVYVELSNEVWNGSFSAFQQAINAGKAGGLPGSNEWYQGIAHEMYRALEVYQLFEGVFGGVDMGTRVIRVFSESGNLDLTTQALRNVYASEHWNPNGQKIDAIMLAPYIGNGTSGASETLTRWKSEVDSKVNGEPIATALRDHVQAHDIPMLGCYEAGMHHLQTADAWARNPAAYDGYVYMLDRFAEKMNGPCALYTLHGTWEPKGAWGLYNAVGQATADAPKARATMQWIAGTATRGSDRTRFICTIVVAWFVVMLIGIALIAWRRKLAKQKHDDGGGE
jgi:hypothetical protein